MSENDLSLAHWPLRCRLAETHTGADLFCLYMNALRLSTSQIRFSFGLGLQKTMNSSKLCISFAAYGTRHSCLFGINHIVLIVAAGCLITASPAYAAVRTYFLPEIEGYRADSCLADKHTCGKPVADAWCQANGWTTALVFQRESLPVVTRTVDSHEFCFGPACIAFRQIKCFTPTVATAPPPNG